MISDVASRPDVIATGSLSSRKAEPNPARKHFVPYEFFSQFSIEAILLRLGRAGGSRSARYMERFLASGLCTRLRLYDISNSSEFPCIEISIRCA